MIRKMLLCRLCDSRELFLVYDFGLMPLANELIEDKTQAVDEFPLRFFVCSSCGLGQVENVVPPSRIFSDYRYLSSASSTFLKHAEKFANFCDSSFLDDDDWILEIASNDGYLLRSFKKMGYRVLGIEPAKNVASLAQSFGIETVNEFFTLQQAEQILSEFGYPRLIIANNVVAHVPDILDFTQGISKLVGKNTFVSIENPSILGILCENQFDTIYHEHFSYLSTTSLEFLSKLVGLRLVGVEQIPIHGGSNRYWLTSSQSLSFGFQNTKDILLRVEKQFGIQEPAKWSLATHQFKYSIDSLRDFLENPGNRIVGYGAAAKASTIINATHFKGDGLLAIVDISPEKQGRFMPRRNIPIVNLDELKNIQFTDVVVFPWNISDEIVKLLNGHGLSNTPKWSFVPVKRRLS